VVATTHLAYRFAARKPQLPSRAAGGVRHFMLVDATMCCRNASTSVMLVLTATCGARHMKPSGKGSYRVLEWTGVPTRAHCWRSLLHCTPASCICILRHSRTV
jgi:hypothetical protein